VSAIGCLTAVAYSVDEALKILASWSALRKAA